MNQVTSKISDATMRRFLLAQLSAVQQTAFEAELFAGSELEHRARLGELELIDDYAADRLGASDRAAFRQKFLVAASRQQKLEVSTALRQTLAAKSGSRQPHSLIRANFDWRRVGWRVAVATLALLILFASAAVIRREPQIVRNLIPKRLLRRSTAPPPTPEPAHHAPGSSESPTHDEDLPPLPSHEAAPQMIVLRPTMTAGDAPVFTLAQNTHSSVVRLELMLDRTESASVSIIVTSNSGEVVHNVPEMHVEAADRLDFDVKIERLKPGDFQVTLKRIGGEPQAPVTYYLRVQ